MRRYSNGKREWHNVPGNTILSAERRGRLWYLRALVALVPPKAAAEVVDMEAAVGCLTDPDETIEVEFAVDWLASGYYDPGQLCGPPERCYPPEGENEQVLDGQIEATLYYGQDAHVTFHLSKDASEELFDAAIHEIENTPVESELDYGGRED